MRDPKAEAALSAEHLPPEDLAAEDLAEAENAGQLTYWNEIAGAKWVANQNRIDRLMAPLSDALLVSAAPRPGESVIDIGTGCGDTALRLASEVTSAGDVLAVDISKPMLAHAAVRETRLPPGDRAPIAWREADAMTTPFEPTRDLLVSRFGVMFFDDVPRAFANLRSALKPGGRFALLTWRHRAEIEWMQAPLDWIAPVLPSADEVPGEIGPFALANAETTCRLLIEAGFADVTAEPVDRSLVVGEAAPDGPDPDAAALDEALLVLADAGPAARLLRDADPDVQARAVECLRAGLKQHVRSGLVVLEGACWIYRGRVRS